MLNEPITRALGRRGLCESPSEFFWVYKVGESGWEEGLNEPLLVDPPVNRAGELQSERGVRRRKMRAPVGSILRGTNLAAT